MLFICHSLGGIILKQALCIANEQLYRYEVLVNSVLGIIFLGTPHVASSQAETWDKSSAILKLAGKKAAKTPAARVAEESIICANIAKRFEGVYLRTPNLSVYEEPKSRSGLGRLSGSAKVV